MLMMYACRLSLRAGAQKLLSGALGLAAVCGLLAAATWMYLPEPLIQATGMKDPEVVSGRAGGDRWKGGGGAQLLRVVWVRVLPAVSTRIPCNSQLLNPRSQQSSISRNLAPRPTLPATLPCADRSRLQLPACPCMGPDCAGRCSGVPVSLPGTTGALKLPIERGSNKCLWVRPCPMCSDAVSFLASTSAAMLLQPPSASRAIPLSSPLPPPASFHPSL